MKNVFLACAFRTSLCGQPRTITRRWIAAALPSLFIALLSASVFGCNGNQEPKKESPVTLSHEQTLEWITNNQAWRLAKKTKPIWARPVLPGEIGKEFKTADHPPDRDVKEKARAGFWLCVGVAGEPWFQKPERVTERYEPAEEESKQFSFDTQSHRYRLYKPKEDARNWVAQIKGPGIEGFEIRPNYDMDHPLYAPKGGFVVMDHVPDPYQGNPKDVWLVQERLFNSTYEFIP